MENETNETWRDRKRRELMEKQMKMAYEVARISIEIKKLREEPPVPEGSVPLSMIEPLINETVERLMLLKEAKKPKPKPPQSRSHPKRNWTPRLDNEARGAPPRKQPP